MQVGALLGAYVETMMLLFMKNISVNAVAHFSTGEWLSFALVVTQSLCSTLARE
jgi:hypothetical protein